MDHMLLLLYRDKFPVFNVIPQKSALAFNSRLVRMKEPQNGKSQKMKT